MIPVARRPQAVQASPVTRRGTRGGPARMIMQEHHKTGKVGKGGRRFMYARALTVRCPLAGSMNLPEGRTDIPTEWMNFAHGDRTTTS